MIALAALAAGAINSIAGGGTLISFPALVWIGVNPVMANATNSFALWPGSFAAMVGFRRELARHPALAAAADDSRARRRRRRRDAADAHVDEDVHPPRARS